MKSYIDTVSIYVSDLSVSLPFYSSSFGMEILSQNDNTATVRFSNSGDGTKLELIQKSDRKIGDVMIKCLFFI